MVRIIGHTDRGLLHTNPSSSSNSRGGIHFTLTEFQDKRNAVRVERQFNFGPCPRAEEDAAQEVKAEVSHVSLQPLNAQNFRDDQSSKQKSSPIRDDPLFLIALVSRIKAGSHHADTYSASLYLVRASEGNVSSGVEVDEVLARVGVVEGRDSEVRVHFLPQCVKARQGGEEVEVDTTEEEEQEATNFSCTSRLLVLSLEESIILYDVESSISTGKSAQLQVVGSEMVAKRFWWAQWLPLQEAVAFAHFRKPRQSSFDDEEVSAQAPKCFLSVVQFHKDFPRESVLNMPLSDASMSSGHSRSGEGVTSPSPSLKLAYDPTVLTSSSVQLKLLAHLSGAAYLFRLCPTSTPKYSVSMLHHNKTLDVDVSVETIQGGDEPCDTQLHLDVGLYSKDQYLVVVGWPYFVHFLDVGSSHEPSHHLDFSWDMLGLRTTNPSPPFLCLFNVLNADNGKSAAAQCDEKTDLSPKFSTTTNLVFQDLAHTPVELTSSLLLPLMEKRKTDTQFKLAVLHHFLVHVGDINVAKRIIYDEGKMLGNLGLKQIYQEFLIGHAHLQAKKQILPNMDSFLYLIPYSADPESNSSITTPSLRITTQGSKDVSIMLLSPSQRVFPHNVTDCWTCLWQLNRNYSRSKRFNHKDISEKLILSLQCYKPEALSRASTPGPMSPSSPMICTSLGDIVGMFGRRATELQLPFVEQESCTANKQEYIFSINLREISMHLLKERKEWPLHGHTVAGKYVCALGDTARLLCHLLCLTAHLQPTKNRDKGFKLIDALEWDVRLKLFMLMEHYTLALSTLACPLPQGFTPFFAYLGYRVFKFDQFLWHVRAGTFDLQIDLVKTIMTDIKEDKEENVTRKLQLLSLLPKTRASRILNAWPHKMSVSLRARQHASDLLSGSVSQNRKRMMTLAGDKKKKGDVSVTKEKLNPLDTFFQLLTAKANSSEIDLGLLTEATLVSMEGSDHHQSVSAE
ncbi:protein pigeon [Folsomia candida]|uniref:protein pigeon n=1 Tax=Folsomia candida TaxID=158441 RepID=UPI000B9052CC|nr:protein pigeon [Folsomia candida]